MNEKRQNAIVGAVGVVGIAVMFGLVFVFGGGGELITNTYSVNVHFKKEIVGVQEGQGVTLNGKRVGQTRAVEFYDSQNLAAGVKVVLSIDETYDVPEGSTVRVESSIMGFGRPAIKIVVNAAGSKPLPRDGTAEIEGSMVPILDLLLPPDVQNNFQTAVNNIGAASTQIGDLATALNPLAKNLTRLVDPRTLEDVDLNKVVANLDSVIQRLDLSLKALNGVLGDRENQENLKATLAGFRRITDFGPQLMKDLIDLTQTTKTTVIGAGDEIRRIGTAIDQLSVLLTNMNKTILMLNEGTGTASLLLRDNRLYESLVLAVERLNKSLDEFREAIAALKKKALL